MSWILNVMSGCYATVPALLKPPPAPTRGSVSVAASDVVVIVGGGAPHQHGPLPQSAPILPCSADAPLLAHLGLTGEREQLLQLQFQHRYLSQGHDGQPPQFGLRRGDSAFLGPPELLVAASGGHAHDLTEGNPSPLTPAAATSCSATATAGYDADAIQRIPLASPTLESRAAAKVFQVQPRARAGGGNLQATAVSAAVQAQAAAAQAAMRIAAAQPMKGLTAAAAAGGMGRPAATPPTAEASPAAGWASSAGTA